MCFLIKFAENVFRYELNCSHIYSYIPSFPDTTLFRLVTTNDALWLVLSLSVTVLQFMHVLIKKKNTNSERLATDQSFMKLNLISYEYQTLLSSCLTRFLRDICLVNKPLGWSFIPNIYIHIQFYIQIRDIKKYCHYSP